MPAFMMAHPWMTFFLGLFAIAGVVSIVEATTGATSRVLSGGTSLVPGRRWLVSGTGVRQIA